MAYQSSLTRLAAGEMHPKEVSILSRAVKNGRKFQNPVPTHLSTLGMLPKVLYLYLTNKDERSPRRPLGPFHTDTRIYQQPPVSGARITWLGHSSMLVEIDGARILIDPVWDKRASPFNWSGPKRFFAPPLALEDLPPLDVVLISHDHFDHLGKETMKKLARLESGRGAQWLTSLGVGTELQRFGVRKDSITELDWTESKSVKDLTITALPARHFSGRSLFNRFETLWSSFVLKGNRYNFYYGADSGLWDGLGEISKQYGPFDLTMLEIGAYNELWKAIHMGPDGAGQAFEQMGANGLLMPIHWGLFELAPEAWRQPIQRITELANQKGWRLWSPEPGIPTEVVVGEAHQSEWWRL
jgi:L-ascorbate metabolism protein UlaG (beta-lactamase superfamily)